MTRVFKSESPTGKQSVKLTHEITGDGHTAVFNTGNPTFNELTHSLRKEDPNRNHERHRQNSWSGAEG